MNHEENTKLTGGQEATEGPSTDVYERPEVVDLGTLTELTLGGGGVQTDSLIGAGS